jgi:hypothetical protein
MRLRRTAAQWQALMNQFEVSGKTQEQFCRSKGLALATFAMWRRKLRSTALEPMPPTFLEVHLPGQAEVLPAESQECADLVVELPYGVTLSAIGKL